ncbi:MAG: DUF6474 family protein [Gordonia sp. (in: high G+C Gram-positive bacteria)]|uniref:DUF6474 family protein n=1 Tax=Gordonia sp. (in: high G+C Gram-positive bacteria) TaxID=84139 RepID=UPI003BB5B90D
MGLLSSRQVRRAERKAEAKIRKAEQKALKTRVKLEARVGALEEKKRHKKALREEHKYLKKAHKAERKTTKTGVKAEKKSANVQRKAAAEEAKAIAAQAKATQKQSAFAPAKIRRYLTVGKMVAPIAGPILYRGAIAARAEITAMQARRAGVPAELLTQHGGPSAPLRARIDAARNTAESVTAQETTAEGRAFVEAMGKRLNNLVVAVDAADTMPPAQRRAAQRAVGNELTAIDNDLLARLNVHP